MDEHNRVQLSLPSNPKFMTLVRCIVAQAAKMAGFEETTAQEIVLAVDEACTNVIRHCYGNDHCQTIQLTVEVSDREYLRIDLRDFGDKQDPSQFKSRDLDEVEPGGLGMHFIYSTMDEVEYDTSVAVGTLMRMKKLVERSDDADHQEQGG